MKDETKRYIIDIILVVFGMIIVSFTKWYFKLFGAVIIGLTIMMDSKRWVMKEKEK